MWAGHPGQRWWATLIVAIALTPGCERGGAQVEIERPSIERPSAVASPEEAPSSEVSVQPPDSIGTIAEADGGARGCPAGFSCEAVTVTCPGVPTPTKAQLATRHAPRASGTVVFFSGESGRSWWAGPASPAATTIEELAREGLTLVQVRWPEGWSNAQPGQRVGLRALSCRPATVLWHLARTHGSSEPGTGRCQPLCATGNSGGASQLAYALADHEAGRLLDTVVLTSGPPHAALSEGCAPSASERSVAERFEPVAARGIDAAYGYTGAGPCARGDASFIDRWIEDDIGPVTISPTSLILVLGGEDHTSAPSHALAWVAEQDDVTVIEVPEMAHNVQRSPEGLLELVRSLVPDAGG